MDPNACWKRLTDALRAGDVEEASDAALDLSKWCRKGGELPKAMKAVWPEWDKDQHAETLALSSLLLMAVASEDASV